jgi:hypothetical protein
LVLGVAILVAVLDTLGSADPIGAFDGAWLFIVTAAGLGAVAAIAIGGTGTDLGGTAPEMVT